jgi:hypothetical protein
MACFKFAFKISHCAVRKKYEINGEKKYEINGEKKYEINGEKEQSER